jgi:hypothetical protein
VVGGQVQGQIEVDGRADVAPEHDRDAADHDVDDLGIVEGGEEIQDPAHVHDSTGAPASRTGASTLVP